MSLDSDDEDAGLLSAAQLVERFESDPIDEVVPVSERTQQAVARDWQRFEWSVPQVTGILEERPLTAS